MSKSNKDEIILKGIAASPGVAQGLVYHLLQVEIEIPSYYIDDDKKQFERDRLEKALLETRRQITTVRNEIADKLGEDEARIFDAHLLVLEDNALIDETMHELDSSNLNIEFCYHKAASRYIDAFVHIDDEYLKERVSDLRDVTKRVLENLVGETKILNSSHTEGKVIVSTDLTPSDAATIGKSKVGGIATNLGSRNSHAIIMARSLDIPAVIGLHDITDRVQSDDYVLINGYDGILIINPSESSLERYGKIKREKESIERVYKDERKLAAISIDGHSISILANIDGSEDFNSIKDLGSRGVGLFRTESIFLRDNKFPSEEDQFQIYRKVVEAYNDSFVIIRTIDLGGDKIMQTDFFEHKEENPFMGFRAIRFCLEHTNIFKDQLRAILRASVFGNIKIMYPFINDKEELIAANNILDEAKDELRTRGVSFNEHILVGSMIELPSAVFCADDLAEHCSFFSIGTNDLIQYILAVDRVNDKVSHIYKPNHPAVLRAIKIILDAGKNKNIPVGVCGEMAGDPLFVPLLFGMGVNELSMTANAIPQVNYIIRNIKYSDAVKLAGKVLNMNNANEIFKLLMHFYSSNIESLINASIDHDNK